MKTTKPIILLIVLLLASCKHDESLQQGTAQFAINHLAGSSPTGRKQMDEIPDGSSLILTLSKSNGDSVFTWKKISLLKIGSQFITPPIPLLQGNYSVDDFIIVGPDNAVLFITPKQGSPLASLVTHSVPIGFNVNTNNVSNVDVEVISADHGLPEEFGYASFPLKISTPDLSISLFTAAGDGTMSFTDGRAIILQGLDTIFQKAVTTSINGLSWNAQPDGWYRLVIIKDGHDRYTKDFRVDLLKNELAGKPLAIVLQPAFTMMWSAYLITSPPAFSPNLALGGVAGTKLKIDWGDGVTENVVLPDVNIRTPELDHTYARAGKYFVSVTGDLKGVSMLIVRDYTATFHSISLQQLPELTHFYISHQIIRPGFVDFSYNPKLLVIACHHNIGLSSIDISHNQQLIALDMSYNQFSTSVVNKVIDDMYTSTVMFGKTGGGLYLAKDYLARTLIGPPSPDRLEKLTSLKRDYNWTVSDF